MTKSIIVSKFGAKGLKDADIYIKQIYSGDDNFSFSFEQKIRSKKFTRNLVIIIISSVIVILMFYFYIFVYLPYSISKEQQIIFIYSELQSLKWASRTLNIMEPTYFTKGMTSFDLYDLKNKDYISDMDLFNYKSEISENVLYLMYKGNPGYYGDLIKKEDVTNYKGYPAIPLEIELCVNDPTNLEYATRFMHDLVKLKRSDSSGYITHSDYLTIEGYARGNVVYEGKVNNIYKASISFFPIDYSKEFEDLFSNSVYRFLLGFFSKETTIDILYEINWYLENENREEMLTITMEKRRIEVSYINSTFGISIYL